MARMQSASGYGGLESTPLARPGYFNEIMNRVYERDFLPEITNSQIDERITYCHQQVQIMKAPEVGEWRTLQKNQEMIPNQVSTEAICLEVCNAAYNDIKIDQLDIRWACERWDAWEEAFLDAVYEKYVEMQRKWVLTAMIIEASPRNQGAHAGQYHKTDLGSRGNPVVVNKDNIALQVTKLQEILMDNLRWVENDMFLVVPVQFRSILAQSNYANQDWIGTGARNTSFNIDGKWEQQLCGFNVIETVQCPHVVEDDGRVCFYILAGNRDGYVYASDIVDGRIVQPERTWSAEYQMLAVWGGKMIYPECVCVAYWTFDTQE